MQMLDHFRKRLMGILDFQLWHNIRSVIILTGPGKQCLTARKMFVWPWPVPRGNPVVYVSMSLKDRHKILRGCKSDNGTSEDINEKGCLLKHIKCRILIKSIRTVFDVRMNHAEGNMYIKSTIQCWLDSAENNILKHIIVMDREKQASLPSKVLYLLFCKCKDMRLLSVITKGDKMHTWGQISDSEQESKIIYLRRRSMAERFLRWQTIAYLL